jgi:hypothetical protein
MKKLYVLMQQTCTVEDILVKDDSFLPSRLAATDSQSFSAISSA